MPSTYTVNLGIEKPATGEQSGTWGDTTNVNFDILDQAINGAVRVTLTSAGSSGSPNALQITNGATSDGRNKWIEFYSSGDLGGSAYVQLDPNDAEKIVFVRNSLASSRSVILFQGTYNSARDLEVPAGVDMVVKFDGGGASAATVTDVYTKLRVTELTTPTLTATTADINGGTLDNSVIGGTTAAAITGTTIVANTSLNIAGDGATVTGIKDEDNMASNSATKLATQQSIKAYVDSQVGTVDTLAEILANGNTSGSNNLIIDNGQALTSNTINETTAGSGVTIDSVLLKDDVVNATDVETSNISANDGTAAATIANSTGNFTITNFISNSVDIGGGAIDGTVIGGATPGSGAFTTLSTTSTFTAGATTRINGELQVTAASGKDRFTIAPQSAGSGSFLISFNEAANGYEPLVVDFENLNLRTAGTGRLLIGATEIVANDSSTNQDFRVESDSYANMLVVDGGTNRVGIRTSPAYLLHVDAAGAEEDIPLRVDGYKTGIQEIWLNNERAPYSTNGRGTQLVFGNNGTKGAFIQAAGYGSGGNGELSMGIQRTGGAGTLQTAFLANSNTDVTFIRAVGSSTAPLQFQDSGASNLMTLTSSGVVVNEDSADRDFRVESDSNTHMLFVDAGNNTLNINHSTANGAYALFVQGTAVSGARTANFQGPDVNTGTGTSASVVNIRNTNSTTGNFSALTFGSASDGTTAFIGAKNLNHSSFFGDLYIATRGANNSYSNKAVWHDTEFVSNEDSINYDFRVESDSEANMFLVEAGNDRIFIAGGPDSYDANKLNIRGSNVVPGSTNGNVGIYSTDNMTSGVGGSLTFGGRYTTSGTYYMFGGIQAVKKNATSGNSAGTMKLYYVNSSNGTIPYHLADESEIQFNPDGNDVDFRVEGNNDTHLIYGDATNDRVGISTNAPAAGLEVASSILFRQILPTNFNAHSGNSNGNYWKLGDITLSGTQSAEINVYGTDSYSAGQPVVGKSTLMMRGNNADTTIQTMFYSETSGTQPVRDARWLNTGTNTYAIYIAVGTFAGLENVTVTGGTYVPDLTDTGSTTAPTNSIQFATNKVEYAGSFLYPAVNYSSSVVTFNESGVDRDFRIESNSNANCFRVDAGADSGQGVVLFGQGAASAATNGAYFSLGTNNAHLVVANTQTSNVLAVAYLNRQGSDGTLMEFRKGNNAKGSITVSGATVSFNGFSGRHESSGIPSNTPVGTVVSTIDELDVYPNTSKDTEGNVVTNPEAGQTRADHAKVEVSTSVGDSCVYGVVSEFDNNGKLIVTSVGIGSVRVTGACAKGDLLESNGDGTATVQSDDIVRSKTIGKVTIGNSDTGVKLVSCVMYCG